jgi:hypothetical protein
MRQFARIKIHALALEQEKHLAHSQINPLTFLEIFPTCASEINSLLEFIINTSTTEYSNLSITNWAPIIQSVIIFPKLFQFSIMDLGVATTWQDMIQAERATYLAQIDRLCDRLEEASITNRQSENKLPDLFYLFCTVLRLFKDNLVRESQLPSTQSTLESNEHINKRARSRCPVVNGDLQSTDYWTMWLNSNNLMSDVELFGVQEEGFPEFDINDPAVFDLNAWVDFSV